MQFLAAQKNKNAMLIMFKVAADFAEECSKDD